MRLILVDAGRTITSAAGVNEGDIGPIFFDSPGSVAAANVVGLLLEGPLSGNTTYCIDGFPPIQILDDKYAVTIPRDGTPVVGPIFPGASATGGTVNFTSFYGLPGTLNWQLVPDDFQLPAACEQPNASTIECENQILRESMPLAGTAFSLVYSSDRSPGRNAGNPAARAHAASNGGWNLSIHHRYDPSSNTLFWGSGGIADAVTLGTIAATADGKFQIPSADAGRVYVFDSGGRHLETRDAVTGLPRYQFSYDAVGNLISVTDEDALVTRIERNSSGGISAFVSPFGLRSTVTSDGGGLMTGVTDPSGATRQMTYGSGGLLASYTNARGSTSTFTYGSDGRLLVDADAGAGRNTLTRVGKSDGSYEVRRTTAENRVTVYNVNPALAGGESRVIIAPSGLSANSTRTSDNLLTSTLPDGTHVATRQDPDPRFGRAAPIVSSTVTTPSGLQMDVARGRTVVLADPTNPSVVASLTQSVSLNGKTTTSRYDAASRSMTTTTPEGRTDVTRFDNKGRAVFEQVDGLYPLQVEYDNAGRQTAVKWGAGNVVRTWRWSYGPDGFLASTMDPEGRVQTFTLDAVGRVTRKALPNGRNIDLGYDAEGNVTSITPPGRQAHAFRYSPVGLRTDYLPPINGLGNSATQYVFNADRDLTRVNRADGRAVQMGYDSAGRPITTLLARGTEQIAYSSATGQLVTIDAPDGIKDGFTFDGWLPTGETWTGPVSGGFKRIFDNDFRIAGTQVNAEAPVPTAYDRDGLIVRAGNLSIVRNPRTGLVIGASIGIVNESMAYTGFGETAGHRVTAGGRVLFDTQYSRDTIGRIIGRSESVQGVRNVFTYAYDVAGRLVQVRRNGLVSATYSYDAAGNRVSRSTPAGIDTGTYDDQDRAVSYAGYTFAYREDGQLRTRQTAGAITGFDYDELGNLAGVTLADGRTLSYLIDGLERRIGKRINGALQQGFLYDGKFRIVAELDGASAVVSRFVYGARNDVPEYMVRGGAYYRIVADQVGSPRLVVNTATGEVVQRLDYDEFGNVTVDSNPGFQPFGFAGGLYDRDTKLVRFGARDYDPSLGRWTARDPLLFDGGQSNLYLYVGNDPVNLRDPSGLADPEAPVSVFDSNSNVSSSDGDSTIKWIKDKLTSIVKDKAIETVTDASPDAKFGWETWKKGIKIVETIDKFEDSAIKVIDTIRDLLNPGVGPRAALGILKDCACRTIGAFSDAPGQICDAAADMGESTVKAADTHNAANNRSMRDDNGGP